MYLTFLDPFLWYQLLKLAVDHFSSPYLPNYILFFDNSEHPHLSLLLLQSHWLMALPGIQNKSQKWESLVCCRKETERRKTEVCNDGTTYNKVAYPKFSNNSQRYMQRHAVFTHCNPAVL